MSTAPVFCRGLGRSYTLSVPSHWIRILSADPTPWAETTGSDGRQRDPLFRGAFFFTNSTRAMRRILLTRAYFYGKICIMDMLEKGGKDAHNVGYP